MCTNASSHVSLLKWTHSPPQSLKHTLVWAYLLDFCLWYINPTALGWSKRTERQNATSFQPEVLIIWYFAGSMSVYSQVHIGIKQFSHSDNLLNSDETKRKKLCLKNLVKTVIQRLVKQTWAARSTRPYLCLSSPQRDCAPSSLQHHFSSPSSCRAFLTSYQCISVILKSGFWLGHCNNWIL